MVKVKPGRLVIMLGEQIEVSEPSSIARYVKSLKKIKIKDGNRSIRKIPYLKLNLCKSYCKECLQANISDSVPFAAQHLT